MRIIAGELRGRPLKAPPGERTRPMLDRVREALFARLEERLSGARVLDLYAGSGSLGLEALSRGAQRARFVERDGPALAALRKNVEDLGLATRARVWRGDALQRSSWLGGAGADEVYDLVFFDPPYALVRDPDTSPRLVAALEELAADALAPGGVIVVHAPERDIGVLRPGGEWGWDLRTYGSSAVALLSLPLPAA
jgi:16S rRNA (guanine966-N2)-methyltransferase